MWIANILSGYLVSNWYQQRDSFQTQFKKKEIREKKTTVFFHSAWYEMYS